MLIINRYIGDDEMRIGSIHGERHVRQINVKSPAQVNYGADAHHAVMIVRV